jgi:hypothetical protein
MAWRIRKCRLHTSQRQKSRSPGQAHTCAVPRVLNLGRRLEVSESCSQLDPTGMHVKPQIDDPITGCSLREAI